jgi:hypothetical protein
VELEVAEAEVAEAVTEGRPHHPNNHHLKKNRLLKSNHHLRNHPSSDCDSQCKAQLFASGECVGGSVIDSDIRVQGTKIVDKNGNEVVLKGICVGHNNMFREKNSHSGADYYYDVYFKEEDAIDMKEHGATHIDVHATWQTKFMKSDGEINVEFFENWFDHFVDYCEDNEIPHIINVAGLRLPNLEWGAYTIPKFVYEAAGYTSGWWERDDAYDIQADIIFKFFTSDDSEIEESRQKWFNLWKFIADRYGDNKYLIGFSLTNEPTHFTCAKGRLNNDQCIELGKGYSETIEECIDEIRSTGAEQIIFVDKPYLKNFDQIQPVNRNNIVWEAHKYHSTWTPTISGFESQIDNYVERFVEDFGKPLYIGEYGIDPIGFKETLSEDEVKESILGQVNYMDSQPIAGMSFFAWGELDGRGWADWKDGWYTEEETNYIFQTIFEDTSPPIPDGGCEEGETDIDQDGCDAGLSCCCSGQIERINPEPWTDWNEWHSTQDSDATFPQYGESATLYASDWSGDKKLAIIKQPQYLPLKDTNLMMKFTVSVEAVDDDTDSDSFLRCAMVPRLELPEDAPHTVWDPWENEYVEITSLYTEFDFFTGKNTNTVSGRGFKVTVVGQQEPGEGFRTYTIDLTEKLVEDWGQDVYDRAELYYIAPTLEMVNAEATIKVKDVILYEVS